MSEPAPSPQSPLAGLSLTLLLGEPAGATAPPLSDRVVEAQLVIVGGGPAGLTAAIYAARAALSPIVLAGSAAGGQLMITDIVENYPGFPAGVGGPQLMGLFREQAVRFGASIIDVDVERVDFGERPLRLWTGGTQYLAAAVIIATGAQAIWLGLESETRLRGRGVSACATCDGFFFRDQVVAVVGGGDSAAAEALYLTRFVRSVHLVHRRDALRASKIMIERLASNPKITVHYDRVVKEILGADRVEGVVLAYSDDPAATETLPLDGLFVAIGHRPNGAVFSDWLTPDAAGYLVPGGPTAIEGVFVAGDIDDQRYRQAVTAAGEGARAAIDAERWLEEQSGGDGAPGQGDPVGVLTTAPSSLVDQTGANLTLGLAARSMV
jgi:thioredoxin reductase (NADPH)